MTKGTLPVMGRPGLGKRPDGTIVATDYRQYQEMVKERHKKALEERVATLERQVAELLRRLDEQVANR